MWTCFNIISVCYAHKNIWFSFNCETCDYKTDNEIPLETHIKYHNNNQISINYLYYQHPSYLSKHHITTHLNLQCQHCQHHTPDHLNLHRLQWSMYLKVMWFNLLSLQVSVKVIHSGRLTIAVACSLIQSIICTTYHIITHLYTFFWPIYGKRK